MSRIEPKIFDELKLALSSFDGKYFIGEELNRSKLTDDLRNYNEELLKKIFEINDINQHFIKEVAGQKIFLIDRLEETILYNSYWDTSYTKYENRVGLTVGGKFLEDNQDIVLDFPFKDGILTASMTKEDNESGYDDAFLNEVIEKEEIDRLFDKKIFQNVKRYDENGEHSCTEFDKEKDNLIIKGNNLLALHSLVDKYAGQVKLIYIDPPYNTGSDTFIYNDKFNHSAWLTFMKNRLEIAKVLLSDDGVIFVQCDDNELAYLKVIMDDIFGLSNFINNISVKMSEPSGNKMSHIDKRLLKIKETILLYKKNIQPIFNPIKIPKTQWDSEYNKIFVELTLKDKSIIDNISKKRETEEGISEDDLGVIDEIFKDISVSTVEREFEKEKTKLTYDEWLKINSYRIFRTAASSSVKKLTDDKKKNNSQTYFSVLSKRDKLLYISKTDYLQTSSSPRVQVLFADDYLTTYLGDMWTDISTTGLEAEGSVQLKNGKKPEKLLKRIIEFSTNEGDLVLDFFMGSGTTQAVAMKTNRRFIGMEQIDGQWVKSLQRLKSVVNGDSTGTSKEVNWQGGGSFVYAELFPKNMDYLQDIIHSKTIEELKSVFERMIEGTDTEEAADISFRADLSKIDWMEGFDANKRLLVKILDKNGLYYNYSEIDDQAVREFLSDEDYTFNKDFYESED